MGRRRLVLVRLLQSIWLGSLLSHKTDGGAAAGCVEFVCCTMMTQ
jgi:hypothetical protein